MIYLVQCNNRWAELGMIFLLAILGTQYKHRRWLLYVIGRTCGFIVNMLDCIVLGKIYIFYFLFTFIF